MSVGKPGTRRALVFGGYGTFGRRVCAELASRGLEVTVVGRDKQRARAECATLPSDFGQQHRAFAADATQPDATMLRAHHVVASCAGPFSRLGTVLLEACIEVGVPYVDLSDDRAQVAAVLALDGKLRARNLTAIPACSSLPGLSGALALLAADGRPPAERARLTLFVGNKNKKGTAAVRSAVGVVGRPIAAPQGTLRGFGGAVVVELPAPFGRRRVYNFESPDYDLLPPLLGVSALEVKVGFELGLAGRAFGLLGKLGSGWGDRTAAALGALGRVVSGVGLTGGVVQAELFFSDGSRRWAAIHTADDGQRAASLPCALACARLAERRESDPVGALTAWQLFGARPLLDEMVAAGFSLSEG